MAEKKTNPVIDNDPNNKTVIVHPPVPPRGRKKRGRVTGVLR